MTSNQETPQREMFTDPDASCAHLFHWDDADGLYRCIYCDNTREEPPA